MDAEPPTEQAIAAQVVDPSATGIAATVGQMISSGRLTPDQRLPTVRALAKQLGVSPATVSQAWQQLRRAGLVLTSGRRGTRVRSPAALSGPTRFGRLHPSGVESMLDLSESVPDPTLLPDVRGALARLSRDHRQTSYFDHPILPELEAELRGTWPFEPESLTIVDGVLDAIDRLLTAAIKPGTRIVVENPTFPPILDLCELLGAEVIGLPVDDRGLLPAHLRAAVAAHAPRVVLLQPRGQNPSGHSMDPQRVTELAHALAASDTLIIEDDHSAGVCVAAPVSLGIHLPRQTIHIRGFSKSHGPDLRLAAVGGAQDPIDDLQRRRLLGAGWSSRLLQDVLLSLLRDPTSVAGVEHARDEYAHRRLTLQAELTQHGIRTTSRDGSNLWIPVRNEHEALMHLALHGIAVAPGSAFTTQPLESGYLRVACAPIIPEHAPKIAEHISIASQLGRRR